MFNDFQMTDKQRRWGWKPNHEPAFRKGYTRVFECFYHDRYTMNKNIRNGGLTELLKKRED